MTKKVLYSTGYFEVGDMFLDERKVEHEITDVLVCHYIKRGTYKVLYEVDHTGEFVFLVPHGTLDDSCAPKPRLHLHNSDEKYYQKLKKLLEIE